jgi:hypothetical protein
LNITAAEDNDKVKYFLNLALKGLLERVLQWNAPPCRENAGKLYYSLEIDSLILKIFLNLVNSDEAFDNGAQLASDEKDFFIL